MAAAMAGPEFCLEVPGGAWRCLEVLGGAWRCIQNRAGRSRQSGILYLKESFRAISSLKN
ncbi:hypothetical protein BDZ91DRAFT_709135 [Kalaharituber pfeilii]|nr:hypothetical protein BDZ91DRAFT_709135 [Kalaharituber pfeilii]